MTGHDQLKLLQNHFKGRKARQLNTIDPVWPMKTFKTTSTFTRPSTNSLKHSMILKILTG